MRKLMLFFLVGYFYSISSFGQNLNPNQHLYVMAKFLDSVKLVTALMKDKEIKNIYYKLAHQQDYDRYDYYFIITKNGKVVPKLYPEGSVFRQLISRLNTCSWQPAYIKKTKKFLNSQGAFTLTISPVNKFITATIAVSAGISDKNFGTHTAFEKNFKIN